MKKQKRVLKRKKQKMSNPATLTAPSPSPVSVDVPTPQYRSIIGRILQLLIATAKSPLARAVVLPSKNDPRIGTIVPFDPSTVPDYITYASYVNYCKMLDVPLTTKEREHYESYCKELGIECCTSVTPRSIERWDTLRNGHAPTTTLASGSAWIERNVLHLDGVVKPKGKGKLTPYKSKWCKGCEEYVEQNHGAKVTWCEECDERLEYAACDCKRMCQPAGPHTKPWQHTTAIALQKGWTLWFSDKRKREQERLQRLCEFTKTTSSAHKVEWDKSFGNLFALMVVRGLVFDYRQLDQLETCESRLAWQHELATWPPFVPYNPNNTTQVVIRDPEQCSSKCEGTAVVDYLVPCKHPNLREFTFSTGETIKLCPNCTAFDRTRQAALKNKVRTLADAKMQHTKRRWEERLEAEGLGEEPPDNPIVSFRAPAELVTIEHAKAAQLSTGGGRRTNFTESEGHGTRGDSSRREYHAKEILKRIEDREPLTKCFDPYSGETFWERKGTIFHPNTSHKQRFHEELPDIRVDLQLLRLKSTLLILKELQEKRR